MKRGQQAITNAGGAAGVVAVIAGFIVLYVLLVNPEARNELLGETTTTNVSELTEVSGDLLLLENPGTVFEAAATSFEHRINSFNLYTTASDSIIKSVESAYISTSRSSAETKKVILALADPTNTKNTMLSFNVKEHRGRLIILVNDKEVFNGEVSGFQQVKLDGLGSENLIELKASSIGWLSFTPNYYEIADVKITGTVTDISASEAINNFYLDPQEAANLKTAYLIYVVDCKKPAGKISIYLNNDLIESKAPDCGSPSKTTLDIKSLTAGKNTLKFIGEGNTFMVDQVAVKTELKEPIFPVYYFEVNSTQFKDITSKNKTCELTMKFVDDSSVKRAQLNINSHIAEVDTTKADYTKTLDAWLKSGNNYVRIVPERTVQIVELRVELKKK